MEYETTLIKYIDHSELKPGENYYIQDTESNDGYWYLKFERHSGSRNQYNWFICLDEPKMNLIKHINVILKSHIKNISKK